jgi:DNA-directed RNA polymerase specialized sigma24 family protein
VETPAVLLTADWHAAEDLVQASLVKLYRAWPKLQPDGNPDAYLRRIMVNTHRSWWRARWRRETPARELPETVIADFADRQVLGAQVRQALPQRQRAASNSRGGTGRLSGTVDVDQRGGPGHSTCPCDLPVTSTCS